MRYTTSSTSSATRKASSSKYDGTDAPYKARITRKPTERDIFHPGDRHVLSVLFLFHKSADNQLPETPLLLTCYEQTSNLLEARFRPVASVLLTCCKQTSKKRPASPPHMEGERQAIMQRVGTTRRHSPANTSIVTFKDLEISEPSGL